MAKGQVDISLNTEELVAQLAALRTLCSQMGFALDTAILKLTSGRESEALASSPPPGPELPRHNVRAGLHLPVRPGDYSTCSCGWTSPTDDHRAGYDGHLINMFGEGRGDLGSDLAVSGGGSGVRIPSPDDPSLPEHPATKPRPEPPSTLLRYDGSAPPSG